jgi:hypothetical protein
MEQFSSNDISLPLTGSHANASLNHSNGNSATR